MIDEGSCADPSSQDGPVENNEKEAKRAARERERNERRTGKLTDLTYDALATGEKSVEAMVRRREVVLVKGTKSQFDARTGKLKTLMPPVTCDCCQTFSTLSAVLLSSLVGGLSFCTSTINYLLYIAAWLHQISMRRWPQGGVRPTVGDLNHALHLKEFFPSKVMESEFEVVFYNQRHRALDLVQQLCSSTKRPREEEAEQSPKPPICGYVIVSGDYTVSIFSVLHPTSSSNAATSSEEEQWTFYIGDSHGTQPWSLGKASLCGITFTQPRASSTSKLVKEAEGAPPPVPLTPPRNCCSSATYSSPFWRNIVK